MQRKPPEALASVVSSFWYLEVEASDLPLSRKAYPYGAFELIFYAQHPNRMQWDQETEIFTEPEFFYAGQLLRPFRLIFDQPCRCAGVSLHPWAGNCLFALPGQEFTNQLIPVSDLDKNEAWTDTLRSLSTPQELMDALETYVTLRLQKNGADNLVMELCRQITAAATPAAIKHSVDRIGLSRRRVEQRFLQSTGLPIGMFQRKMRFQHAARLIQQGIDQRLIHTGLNAGYYDQAHFIHEFRKFSGLTPTQFIRQHSPLLRFLSDVGSAAAS